VPTSMADGEGCWTLTPPPPPRTRAHLDGAGPGVEVGRPRGVAALALRGGGGGVTAEGTTAATTAAVVVPLLPSLRSA
jgi:hypothetical protein